MVQGLGLWLEVGVMDQGRGGNYGLEVMVRLGFRVGVCVRDQGRGKHSGVQGLFVFFVVFKLPYGCSEEPCTVGF